MKIVIVAGSPRKVSISHRVALHLYNELEKKNQFELSLIDLKEWQIPHIQEVWSSLEKVPFEFKTIAEQVFTADAYIIVSPEYNGSYSPALKNLFDHFPKRARKPFGIVTASPGAMGGMRASQQLLQLVPALFGFASPSLLIVPAVDKKFDADGTLLDERFQQSVHQFLAEFLWLSEKLTT